MGLADRGYVKEKARAARNEESQRREHNYVTRLWPVGRFGNGIYSGSSIIDAMPPNGLRQINDAEFGSGGL